MKTNQNLYVDLHVIQTVPPSNINRDDTGSPKTAQYGGVTRSRVSSQAWKKAIREYFNKNSEQTNVGIRSLRVVDYVAEKIIKIDSAKDFEEATKLANSVLNAAGISTKDNKAKALFFISSVQAEKLAQAAVDGKVKKEDKKELEALLNAHPAVDIALFGRMVAENPLLNEDASAQVAHAISTHAVQTEFDYYTATDDWAAEDNAGAGMLGTIEYNSSTLYRYANVAVHELLHQLEDKQTTVAALRLLVEAFANSMPTGKVNTFANQTLPQAIVLTVRPDRPVNLVSAFEVPVKPADGYAAASITKLAEEYQRTKKFVKEPIFTLTIGLDGLGEEQSSMNTLLDSFADKVSVLLEEN